MSYDSKELDSVASINGANKTGGLPEINSPTSRNINVGSPMNLRGSDMSKRKVLNIKRMSTKSEEVLAKNNFQQLRALTKKEEKKKALEEAKKKLALQRNMESELLNDLDEQATKEDGSETHSPLMSLAQIEEDEEDEQTAEEAQKLIRTSADGKTVELVSP